YGLALSPDGQVLATVNSGASRFSVTLVRKLASLTPQVNRIDLNATFMGVAFSADGSRFYVSGGENGNIWVGDVGSNRIIGSINLNGINHPLGNIADVTARPPGSFKGAFPGNLVLSRNGRYLYVVDQGGFSLHVIDTLKIQTGLNGNELVDSN